MCSELVLGSVRFFFPYLLVLVILGVYSGSCNCVGPSPRIRLDLIFHMSHAPSDVTIVRNVEAPFCVSLLCFPLSRILVTVHDSRSQVSLPMNYLSQGPWNSFHTNVLIFCGAYCFLRTVFHIRLAVGHLSVSFLGELGSFSIGVYT